MKYETTKFVKAAGHLVNWQDSLSFPFYVVTRKRTKEKERNVYIYECL